MLDRDEIVFRLLVVHEIGEEWISSRYTGLARGRIAASTSRRGLPSPVRLAFDARCRCSSAISQTSCWSAWDHTNNTFKCPSEVGSMKLVGAEAGAPQSGSGGV